MRKSNTGYLGVSKYNHKYYAELVVKGRRMRLGFTQLIEAISKRKEFEMVRDEVVELGPAEEIGRHLDARGYEWKRH